MLDRNLIPSPRTVYEPQFGALRERRGGWAQTKCIFHGGNSKTSLGLNLRSGGFYCFSCGANGGDVIAFVRLRDRVDFANACRALGCWRDGGRLPRRRELVPTAHLVADLVIDTVKSSISIPDEPKNFRQALRRYFVDARDRLHEIRAGDPETDPGESETNWAVMSLAWELLELEDGRR
jgi:hypothetical protein